MHIKTSAKSLAQKEHVKIVVSVMIMNIITVVLEFPKLLAQLRRQSLILKPTPTSIPWVLSKRKFFFITSLLEYNCFTMVC